MSGIIAQNTLDNSGLIKSPEGGGAWTFIKKLTASSSADLSFVDGTSDVVLDSTYREYIFYCVNMHLATATKNFQFQGSIDGGSNYNVAITSTHFSANHAEDDSAAALNYEDAEDLAQGTGFQSLQRSQGIDNDHSCSGILHLFNPSSTTFVKHFMYWGNNIHTVHYSLSAHVAGYFNTTSAIDAIQFTSESGNIDSGDIFLHGLTI